MAALWTAALALLAAASLAEGRPRGIVLFLADDLGVRRRPPLSLFLVSFLGRPPSLALSP